MTTLIKFFAEGGAFMYVLLAISVVSVAIICAKIYSLNFWYNFDDYFFSNLLRQIRHGNAAKAQQYCMKTRHPLAGAIRQVLESENYNKDTVESMASIAYQGIAHGVQEKTVLITMLGSVATLVGLLGTIQGLIIAFQSLAGADPATKATLLAQGISTAMNTTAFGLVIGIPCLAASTIFAAKEAKILNKYEITLGRVVHQLALGAGVSQNAALRVPYEVDASRTARI